MAAIGIFYHVKWHNYHNRITNESTIMISVSILCILEIEMVYGKKCILCDLVQGHFRVMHDAWSSMVM